MIFMPYDFETTGLTVHHQAPLGLQPRPIEFAAILTDGEKIIDEMECIINPEMAIEEIITKITGLTNEDLDDKPIFIDVFPKIAEFMKRADVAIAHNLSFDRNIMQYALARIDKTLADVNFPKIQICTVEQTYPSFGRRMKLSELYELYVGKYTQKHRALDDVYLLNQVCQKIGVYDMFKAA